MTESGEGSQEPKKRIAPKEAVCSAIQQFSEVTGLSEGVIAEEIELSDDGNYWMVTLGYLDPGSERAHSLTKRRSFKLIKVDAYTGDVLSMKMHEL